MNLPVNVTQNELTDILLNIAPERPVFIWGSPGIGKSALVEQFADAVGLPCVSLLGSQLAPEDIIGIPQIRGNTSEFLPPKMIAREEPYVLFLDELNACSQEVQKAFYSLIHERRVGEYHLPEGSVVISAGNRMQDNAIVKTMSSALINRMFHVQLKVNVKAWVNWAYENDLHPWVIDYITKRPDHLCSEPPKTEEPFSTPRSWHLFSDAIKACEFDGEPVSDNLLKKLAYGCLSASHAGMFLAYVKQFGDSMYLDDIISGKKRWPDKSEERDVLYFLATSFRAKLLHDLPKHKQNLSMDGQNFSHRAKSMVKELAEINLELAHMVVAEDEEKEERLPEWFQLELVRDLPRLTSSRA